MLNEKRAKYNTTVEKNLYKLLANSTYGKFVERGLKRMKVKFANTWNEREAIIQKHGYDMIAGTTMYSENLIGIKLNTPVRRVEKPFFIGFAILDMSKHIIYDFYYNVLKNTFDNVELLGQARTHSSYNCTIAVTSFTRCVTCTNRSTSRNWITRATSMENS